ncbi:MAG: hypothetical protein AB1648_09160 [Pseudomonadota bacterium]
MKTKVTLILLTLVGTPLAAADQDTWDAYTNTIEKILVPLSNAFSKKIVGNLKFRATPPPQPASAENHEEADKREQQSQEFNKIYKKPPECEQQGLPWEKIVECSNHWQKAFRAYQQGKVAKN